MFSTLEDIRTQRERVLPRYSYGRVAATDVHAPIDLPNRDKSMVDGFAVQSRDTRTASSRHTVALKLSGTIPVGRLPDISIGKGEACAVATGSWMPHGADASVMMEKTVPRDEKVIEIHSRVGKLENVLSKGEDVRKGEKVVSQGTKLNPYDMGMISGLGISEVEVVKRPLIGVLSTGDEIQDPLSRTGNNGKIYDINRIALSGLIQKEGGEVLDLGIASDQKSKIKSKLLRGLRLADAILVTAGTSVGEKDLLPSLVSSLGKPGLRFHGVAMKPGRPAGYATVDGKPILLLPGFPVSALLVFEVLGRPMIRRLLGLHDAPRELYANLAETMKATLDMDSLVRVRISKDGGNNYLAYPLKGAKSSMISTLTRADGYFRIPKGSRIVEGSRVAINLFRS